MAPIDTLVPHYGAFDLKSATVLITGGSSGIGLGLAEEFLKAGSTVIVTGRREGPLKEAQAKLPKLHIHVNDVSEAEERKKLSAWAVKEFPKLNVLVNNAGIQRRGALAEEPEDWSVRQLEYKINMEAPVHLMQLFSSHFVKQKEAAFVNISSGLAFIPCPFAPVYGATKAFVHHFNLGARFHYAKSKVRVVEIAPPAVKSNLGGSHDYGEDCDVFCEHVFKRFAGGESEIGFTLAESSRIASRKDNEKVAFKMWDGQCKDMPVFESQ